MSVARHAGASHVPDNETFRAPAGGALSQALPAGTPGDPSTLLQPVPPTHYGQLGAGTDRPDHRSVGTLDTQQALAPTQPGPTASTAPAAAPPAVPAIPAVSRRIIGAQRRASSAERRRGTPAAGMVESAACIGPMSVATTPGAPRGSKRKLAATTAAAATGTVIPPAPQPKEQLTPRSGPYFKAEQRAFKRPELSTLARNAAKFVAETERDDGASDGDIAWGAEITRAPSIEGHRGSIAVAAGGSRAPRSPVAAATPAGVPHGAAAAAPAAPTPTDSTPAWAGSSRSSPVSAPPAPSLLAAPVGKVLQQPAISAAALEIMSRLIPAAGGPQADQMAVVQQPHPHQGCVLKLAAIGAVHFKMGIENCRPQCKMDTWP